MNSIIGFMVNFSETLLVFIFLSLWIDFDHLKWKQKISILLIWSLMASGVDYLGLPELIRSLVSISVGLAVLIPNSRLSIFRTVRLYLLSVVVMLMISEVIGTFVCTQLFNIDLSHMMQFGTAYWTVILSCDLVSLAIYLGVRSYLNKQQGLAPDYFRGAKSVEYLIVLALIYIGATFVVSLQLRNVMVQDQIDEKMTITIVLIVVAYIGVFLKLLHDANQHMAVQHSWQIREVAYRQQLEQIKNYESLYEQIKSDRHDFHHHLNCIYGLVEMNHYQELQAYVENLTKKNLQMQVFFECSNPYLSALLHYKYQEGKQKGINIQFDIRLVDSLKVDPLDLSIIVGNALDNAIESCEAIGTQTFLKLELLTIKNQLRINLENSCNESFQTFEYQKRMTSKHDADNHGYGLQNIDYIVQKYDGLMKMRSEKGVFMLQIQMNNAVFS